MFDSFGLDVYYSTKNYAPLLAHTFYFSCHDWLVQCEKKEGISTVCYHNKKRRKDFRCRYFLSIHVRPRLSMPENSISGIALCFIFVVALLIQWILFFSVLSHWFLLRKCPQLKVLACVCTASIIFAARICLIFAQASTDSAILI